MSFRTRGLVGVGVAAALSLMGCGGNSTTPTGDAGAAAMGDAVTADAAGGACVPDRAQWDSAIRAHVARQCGTCHGTSPQFGSPYSLLVVRPIGRV